MKIIKSYLCMKRCCWLSSGWSSIMTFFSSVSASLSASPPLIWLKPWTIEVYFILIPSQSNHCVVKILIKIWNFYKLHLCKVSKSMLLLSHHAQGSDFWLDQKISFLSTSTSIYLYLLSLCCCFLLIFCLPEEQFRQQYTCTHVWCRMHFGYDYTQLVIYSYTMQYHVVGLTCMSWVSGPCMGWDSDFSSSDLETLLLTPAVSLGY